MFPKNAVGTITGFGGALGSLMGAITQHYIGSATESYGYGPIFVVCAVLYPIAFTVMHLLIGKLGVTRKV